MAVNPGILLYVAYVKTARAVLAVRTHAQPAGADCKEWEPRRRHRGRRD